jgi:hypothetical protein
MAARLLLHRVPFLLVVLLLAATVGVSAPIGKEKPRPKADDDMATPALDPAKVADNAILQTLAARHRAISTNNLKQIVLALHSFHDVNGKLTTDILDVAGKPLLSWRVQLLPYLEQDALYKQFKLDEPWDSKNNLPLLEKMPKVLTSPRVKVKKKGYTVYQIFSGPGALFDAGKTKYQLANIPDGTSNTLFAVEATKTVPWTKPIDIPFAKDKDLPDFGKAYGKRPLGSMMDGSVRMLNLEKIKPETLKNAIMPDDGNSLGEDWND